MAENSRDNGRALVASAINAQEEERRRIAREIHDGPAQVLASLVFRVEIAQKLIDIDKAKAKEELERLKDSLRLSLNDVRKIIYDLRPLAIEENGLSAALASYLRSWEAKSGVAVHLQWNAESGRKFMPEVEATIYRLVQESLNNTAKHAAAKNVYLSFEKGEGEYILTVKDDGKGFDETRAAEAQTSKLNPRFGVSGMRERVLLLGGTFAITSAIGLGTTVTVTIPENYIFLPNEEGNGSKL